MTDVRLAEGCGPTEQAPEEPTQKEVDEHECSGHPIYRTWCRTCVQARGELLTVSALGFLNGTADTIS
eukprot:1625016-Amphidinium_carterae.2